MRKGREKLLGVSLILLLFFSIATICIVPVFASETPKLYVNPPSIIDQTLTPPKTFTINVTLFNVTNLYGFEFKLGYDTTILDIVKVQNPPFLNPTTLVVKNETNEALGRYWLGISSLSPAPPKNGSGTLATITFKVTGVGSCALDLYETKLIDNKAASIPHSVGDGYFNNISPAKLYVAPSRIMNPDLLPCKNFTININVLNVINLYTWEFKLYYKNDILNGTGVAEGPFLSTSGPTDFKIKEFKDTFNATHGLVWAACRLLNPPPVSGNGTLATISFHVKALGESVLDLADTALSDPWNGPIPHSALDGYFNNVLKAHLYVYPPSIIDPTLLPPANFTINIKVANVTDLYDYRFKLGYNTAVLNCLGVIIIPFVNETSFTTKIHVDDGAGFLWVNVTYYPPAKPLTTTRPVTLAIIFFQVQAPGASILDLYDTGLSDPYGGEIPHDVSDGYISILRHDVAVVNVVPATKAAYASWIVKINVTVRNEGDIAETFNVSTYYGITETGPWTLIETKKVINLAKGANITLTFNWDTHDVPPCHNYTMKAEASVVPYETDTSDNVYVDGKVKIKMLGDINGDGIIDITDVTIVAIAFGSKPGNPNWNPDADLNGDGIIDITDMVIIAVNYGKTC